MMKRDSGSFTKLHACRNLRIDICLCVWRDGYMQVHACMQDGHAHVYRHMRDKKGKCHEAYMGVCVLRQARVCVCVCDIVAYLR